MFSLVKKIKKKERNKRILILGLDNSGKTTFLHNFLHIEGDISPTFGFKIHSAELYSYNVNFWDLGGQSSIRIFWRNYFEEIVDGIIWVVDSTDRNRVDLAKHELHAVLKSDLHCPVLIVANKQDLEDAMSGKEISQELDLTGITFSMIECSALEDDAPMDQIEWLLRQDIVVPK
eukprot:NODE_204_length_14945_cov_0.251313.p9 type:complete len:175 gc:universal NODE_204_length_14945_cov_0.251313:225-749(+)